MASVVVVLVVEDFFNSISHVLSHFSRAASDDASIDHPAGHLREPVVVNTMGSCDDPAAGDDGPSTGVTVAVVKADLPWPPAQRGLNAADNPGQLRSGPTLCTEIHSSAKRGSSTAAAGKGRKVNHLLTKTLQSDNLPRGTTSPKRKQPGMTPETAWCHFLLREWYQFRHCASLGSTNPGTLSEWKVGETAAGFSITDAVPPSQLCKHQGHRNQFYQASVTRLKRHLEKILRKWIIITL